MEDLKKELECHLMKTDSVCPKLRGLVRRLRCIHAFLLMRRDVANKDVTTEIQKYHTALEQAEEELARSIERAFIEKTGYLRAFQEQIESEYNTINTLKRDVEHFLLELQCGNNCQIGRGRTLSQLFRMMWQNCSVDLEIDDNIDCLEFTPLSSPESLPKIGTVIKNYQKSDTYVNNADITGKGNSKNDSLVTMTNEQREKQSIMMDSYCQTDDDSVVPDFKVVQHVHASCQTDIVKIGSVKHCTSIETQTTKPKVKPDNPGCSVKYLTSQLSSVGLIRSTDSLSSDSLEGMASKNKRKKNLHVTNITSQSKKPACYLMEGIHKKRSHRDHKSSGDCTLSQDRGNSGFVKDLQLSSSNWLEDTERDISLNDSAYSTPAKSSQYDNGDKAVQSEAYLTPDKYWDLDNIDSDKCKGTEITENSQTSQISKNAVSLTDKRYSQSDEFTVTDSKIETGNMNVVSSDASEKVSKISFVTIPESLSAEEEFIVTDIVETLENWEEEAVSFSETLKSCDQQGDDEDGGLKTRGISDNEKSEMHQFDNFTNIKSEQHLENKEISELTSFEVDLKSDRNNQFKSMVASSETKPDSDNSVNICCKDDISGKVVEDNASKMPDTNNSNKNFTVEKVASFTYAMKRSVCLDRDLDQKKKYETYVATDKISKMDHSKKDVKSVKMNRVTKHTKPRIPIIPQESVISEHIRRSNNSYYRGGTHIPPPLPAKLLFKFGLSSKNPASGDYGLSFPIGVASNSKGEIIVADTGNNRIRIFDAHGRFVQGIGSKQSRLKRPSAIVINDDDNIFVKDDICIHVFTPDCKFVRRIGNGQLNAPYGLSMTHDGFLVTLDTKPAREFLRLVIFTQDGSDSTWYPFYTSPHGYVPGSKCRFLAVNGETVIVSDLGRSKVLLKNFLSGQMYSFGRMGRNPGEILEPSGIAVDYDGNILLGDSRNNRVQIFTSGGEFLCGVKFSEGSVRPSDIHLTPDNKLIVTNYIEHQIKVYQLGAT